MNKLLAVIKVLGCLVMIKWTIAIASYVIFQATLFTKSAAFILLFVPVVVALAEKSQSSSYQ